MDSECEVIPEQRLVQSSTTKRISKPLKVLPNPGRPVETCTVGQNQNSVASLQNLTPPRRWDGVYASACKWKWGLGAGDRDFMAS